MRYRTLGQGLKVSEIGVGCMPMVGRAIRGRRAGLVIATKFAHRREVRPFRSRRPSAIVGSRGSS